ncbi:MAG: hypothetical protein GY839_06740 [candidate division Zixibacteria bacterium]|nr:hypothetical protein [candidate division Zixibacteria bacterium]
MLKMKEVLKRVFSVSILVSVLFLSGCDLRSTKYIDTPYQGSISPYPDDNSTNSSVRQTLTWDFNSLSRSGSVTYDVYLGKDNDPPLVSNNQSEIYFQPQDMLDYETNYYWKIMVHGSGNEAVESPVWSFKTETLKNIRPLLTYDTPGNACDLYVDRGIAYVADDRAGLQIMDLTLSCDEAIVGNYNPGGSGVSSLTVSWDYLFLWWESSGVDSGFIEVLDISDPINPILIDTVDFVGYVENLFAYNQYLFASDFNTTYIYDFSDINNIVELPNNLPVSRGNFIQELIGNVMYIGDFYGCTAYDITNFPNIQFIEDYPFGYEMHNYSFAYGYIYGSCYY